MSSIDLFLSKYITKEDNFVLACSWGPDSMYLLYNILESSYKNNLIVCYFNHKLRDQADSEEKYIINLWKELWFKVETWFCDVKKLQNELNSISTEELARHKRYEFLNTIVLKNQAKYMLTAHHLDDKIETFFFNLIRWTKLTWLINMTECSWNILRPLLNITKSEILDFLDERKITFFVDDSNFDIDINRNYLRLEILPKFLKINKNYKKNLNNFMNYLEDMKKYIDYWVKSFLNLDVVLNYEKTTKNENYSWLKKDVFVLNSWSKIINFEWKKYEDFFSLQWFKKLDLFFQKEVIRYIFFIRNSNSTIWLSESNISEVIKFLYWKNNKTVKEIKNLNLKKDWDKIFY